MMARDMGEALLRRRRFTGNSPAPRSNAKQVRTEPTKEKDLFEGSGSLEEMERTYVQRVVAGCATLAEAARRLGINASTLWRMRKRWGLL
jgi:hypothetical protein